MTTITIKLVDRDTKDPVSSCTVRAAFTQLLPRAPSGHMEAPAEVCAITEGDGLAVLHIPSDKEIKGGGGIELIVAAPDGTALHQSKTQAAKVKKGEPLTIEVTPPPQGVLKSARDASYGQPARLRGYVVNPDGGAVGGLQVIIEARASATDAPQVVAAARTDARGYFTVSYPPGAYAEAHGTVAGGAAVPIQLTSGGAFPPRVLLAVEVSAVKGTASCCGSVPRLPDHEDFAEAPATYSDDAGGGHCVDITKPNRVLEEFDYHAVVRTTEPNIVGLTLHNRPRVTASDLAQILNGKPPYTSEPKDPKDSKRTGRRPAVATGSAIDAGFARDLLREPDLITPELLEEAARTTRMADLREMLEAKYHSAAGREALTAANPVDWDNTPTFYQAATIAHGHLLHFKQEWLADGYSLGDLLYSLPLAPCQKKQIAIIDWDRRESASRSESFDSSERLSAQLERDRDISEIAKAAVRESLSGQSTAETTSAALGGAFGLITPAGAGLLAMGVGSSEATSTASQESARDAAASSLQQLRDRTLQAASAVRSQRATVVQTLRQGETARVETEVVANHNHCHALTIEYFEVLRHFLVRHRLAAVQECLFVPLLMSRFDSAKALRWREPLTQALRIERMARGFEALRRITDHYVGSDLPASSYAEADILNLEGQIRLVFYIKRPADKDDGAFDELAWAPLAWLGITPREFWQTHLEARADRDRVFEREVAPQIAERIVDSLRFFAGDADGNLRAISMDATLVSEFRNGEPLTVTLRAASVPAGLRRDHVSFMQIDRRLSLPGPLSTLESLLPLGSRVVVHSGCVRYRSPHLVHALFDEARVLDDLTVGDGVSIATPLSREEMRRPRDEDKEAARALLRHLNDHLEYYHRGIWQRMDAQRRYMLLDGFQAPNSGKRSVASVVENRLVGIVGNCLVLPLAPGVKLNPTYTRDNSHTLLEHYLPAKPIPPVRISVPTKGVFAEAMLGACNACEKKDETRFWRWEESPCPDEPTAIQSPSTESRRAEPSNLQPTPFAAPIVAFQNAPPAPDPTGIGALAGLLGNPNLFRDVTGLSENQRNAIEGLKAAFTAAQSFGDKAANLALQSQVQRTLDSSLEKIDEQHQKGAINDQQRSELTEAALRAHFGGGAEAPKQQVGVQEFKDVLQAAGQNDVGGTLNSTTGQLTVDGRPQLAQTSAPAGTPAGAPAAIPAAPTLTSGASAEARAFNPTSNDLTDVITLTMDVSAYPSDAKFEWIKGDNRFDMVLQTPFSPSTVVQGLTPGPTSLNFEVRFRVPGAATVTTQTTTVNLCVPQFLRVTESPAFNAFLAEAGLSADRDTLLKEMRNAATFLLRDMNVRIVWALPPFNETLPAHLNGSALFIPARIIGRPPADVGVAAGQTFLRILSASTVTSAPFNEPIDIYPGGFLLDPIGTLTIPMGGQVHMYLVIRRLLKTLVASLPLPPPLTTAELATFTAKMLGRALGKTLVHEIGHATMEDEIMAAGLRGPGGAESEWHGYSDINDAFSGSFREKVGFRPLKALVDISLTDDPTASNVFVPQDFQDEGLNAMLGFGPSTIPIRDSLLPVAPVFR